MTREGHASNWDGGGGGEKQLMLSLYRGALSSPPWQEFVHRLRDALRAEAVALVLYPNTESSIEVHVISTDPTWNIDWAATDQQYISHYLDRDPTSSHRTAPGELVSIGTETHSDYYEEFLKPLGIEHSLRMGFSSAGRTCWVSACKRYDCGSFSPDAKSILKELLPHLETALSCYAGIMRSNSERLLYQRALQNMSFGALVLDLNGRVIQCNPVANSLASQYPEINLDAAFLRVADPNVQLQLNAAINRSAQRFREGDEQATEIIRIDCSAGGPIGMLIKPASYDRYFLGEEAPAVVIYLSDLSLAKFSGTEDDMVYRDMVSKLFRLTATESRLALLLADGLTLTAASRLMCIAEKTARNHANNIFEKTGVSRQVELVRLIYRSVAIMGE